MKTYNKSFPSYCVAIRTLGTAGEKYQKTLDSILKQTIQPEKVIVYIAEGYPLPKETIGTEEYVYVRKGMVAQRALPFEEIDTEYGLFLDDDMYLPEDAVEKLFNGLTAMNGDCISPNVFPNHQMTFKQKLKAAVGSFTFPRYNDGWAFKLQRNASYTYNNSPKKSVLLTQSASFNCFLIKMDVYRSIHYEDEIWLDSFKYALGDDLCFYYKLYVNGYRILVHYATGIIHLDAGVGRIIDKNESIYSTAEIWFIFWHRLFYQSAKGDIKERIRCLLSYSIRFADKTLFYLVKSLCCWDFSYLFSFLRGNRDGYRFVCSDEYKNIPLFEIKQNEH